MYGPYVFNDENYLVPIHYIEKITGLDFGALREVDPLKEQDFAAEAAPEKLLAFEKIRFTA